ncbi:T9SS type A sorting domain-containing protein [Chryseobacterium indologenes]|nr:T9SS type A sorting domain-containing protein [Chryseobacterium indologenes]
MKKIYITLLMAIPLMLFSQGENDNWYFGGYAGINFSGSTPVALHDSQMFVAGAATASVSDSSGKLLFYTDGESVWNREHQVMDNGDNLNQYSSWQICIAKHPSNPNLYYIFSSGIPVSGVGKVIRYSVVDISQGSLGQNGLPLGSVLPNFKTVPILNGPSEFTSSKAATIVPHANGTAFWVLFTEDRTLYSYLLDSTGLVNNTPVISNLNIGNVNPSFFSHYSYLKASPRLSCSEFSNYLSFTSVGNNSYNESRVYSFDDSTGKITSDYELVIASLNPFLTEFNSTSSILYMAGYEPGVGALYAINLAASTNSNIVYSSVYPINNTSIPSTSVEGMQRNKYGDIYIQYGYNYSASKILNPDVYGGATLDLYNIYLHPGVGRSFPQLVPSLARSYGGTCIPDKTLLSPEQNMSYTYQVSNTITAKDNYSIDAGKNITMKAGNSITLLPGVDIQAGSRYLGMIEGCETPCGAAEKKNKSEKKSMFLDLRKKDASKTGTEVKDTSINIYPNPASDILHIKTQAKINEVEVYDRSGKRINVSVNNDKVNVKELPAGSYLIRITTEKNTVSKQFIKK